jgi:hypothetical protein
MAEQVDVCNTRAERKCSGRPPTAGLCQFRKSLDLLDNLSSATASTPGGMVRPRALAILILMIIRLSGEYWTGRLVRLSRLQEFNWVERCCCWTSQPCQSIANDSFIARPWFCWIAIYNPATFLNGSAASLIAKNFSGLLRFSNGLLSCSLRLNW